MAESRFHTLLKSKVLEQISSRSESLASGDAKDYPAYRQNVGYILGLKDCLKLCDDTEMEMGG